jgi:hypothetical protein
MRLDEILALTWGEVRFDLGVIILTPRTKNAEGRVVQLTATAVRLLQWLYEHRPAGHDRVVLYWRSGYGEGTPTTISNITRSWKTALRQAAIPEQYRFHDLRGSMSTFLATQIAPLPLQKWLGHKDLKTTMRYIQIAEASQREAAALADAYPGTEGAVGKITATERKQHSSIDEARRFVGVYPSGRSSYQAAIAITTIEGNRKKKRLKYLGSFPSAEQAARAYDAEARKYPGRRTNFPETVNGSPERLGSSPPGRRTGGK